MLGYALFLSPSLSLEWRRQAGERGELSFTKSGGTFYGGNAV
jgi:hypothetical protein